MTKEDAVEDLKTIMEECDGDPEAAHANADQVLCDLLDHLGYGEVVETWNHVEKWYA